MTGVIASGVLTLAVLGPTVQGQSPAEDCGNPEWESSFFLVCPGHVVEVAGADTVELMPDEDCFGREAPLTVRLAGLEAFPPSSDWAAVARSELSSRVLGRKVEVLSGGNPPPSTPMVGILMTEEDEGLRLLQLGLVEYQGAGLYSLDGQVDCRYRAVARKARADGIGRWAEGRPTRP